MCNLKKNFDIGSYVLSTLKRAEVNTSRYSRSYRKDFKTVLINLHTSIRF